MHAVLSDTARAISDHGRQRSAAAEPRARHSGDGLRPSASQVKTKIQKYLKITCTHQRAPKRKIVFRTSYPTRGSQRPGGGACARPPTDPGTDSRWGPCPRPQASRRASRV